jgi:acetyltransferase-like isoleucine patch superfamily enzyme
MYKKIWLLFFSLLPSSWKIAILRKQGHIIGDNVSIGCCYLDIAKIILGNNTYVGNFNYFKNLKVLKMEDNSYIGPLNWFSASRFNNMANVGFGVFRIMRNAGITGRHFFDLAESITIGEETLVAGFRSIFWTHTMSVEGGNINAPIFIGDKCYIGAEVQFVPGSSVGNCTFVGAGAVVTKDYSHITHVLLAGNPAKVRKSYSSNDKWFQMHHIFTPNRNKHSCD